MLRHWHFGVPVRTQPDLLQLWRRLKLRSGRSKRLSALSSSSAGSEARDQLAQAELVERELEITRLQSLKDAAGKVQSNNPGSRGSNSRGLSNSCSEPDASSRSSSDLQTDDPSNVAHLSRKVDQLTQALKDRDDQQVSLLKTMADMDVKSRTEVKRLGAQLKEVKKAEQAAESHRDSLKVAKAGDDARHASQMHAATKENDRLFALSKGMEEKDAIRQKEMDEAKLELHQQKERERAQKTYHDSVEKSSQLRQVCAVEASRLMVTRTFSH